MAGNVPLPIPDRPCNYVEGFAVKVAKIVFAIAAVLVIVGVVLGAIPRSTTVTNTNREVECGSVFFPKDAGLLTVPLGSSRSLTAEDCHYATNETEPWVFMGLGGLAALLGVGIVRGQRQSVPAQPSA